MSWSGIRGSDATRDRSQSELAGLDAISIRSNPPREIHALAGMQVRFSNGFTKRGNSATPLRVPVPDPVTSVTAIESFFAARNQPTIFRLPDFLDEPALCRELDARGYAIVEPSLVMAMPIPRGTAGALDLASDAAEWCAHHAAVTQGAVSADHIHTLERVTTPAWLALTREQGKVTGCGLGVVDGEWFGLFSLEIAADRRGNGLGTTLIESLLQAGAKAGARLAYLQVVANNPAVNLYKRLGFKVFYRYHYRVARL